MFDALVLGLHLGSVHVPNKEYHRNFNPGVYARIDQAQAGYYRNSYGRDTFYAGYVQPLGRVDFMVGLASGYSKKCHQYEVQTPKKVVVMEECKGFSRGALAPLAALSYSVPVSVAGAKPRIWFMPGFGKASSVGHISLEWKQ